ncbi:MAG: hypothetical protein EBV53_13400 [Proteobacteria bacterium]|nr:hypothetical protein [Pseudomonadota bacterium]
MIDGDGSRGVSACQGDPARRHAVSSSATSSTRVGTVSRARTQTCANPGASLDGTRSRVCDGLLPGERSGGIGTNWAGELSGIGIRHPPCRSRASARAGHAGVLRVPARKVTVFCRTLPVIWWE